MALTDIAHSHLTRQRIDAKFTEDMIPLNAYKKPSGPTFISEKKQTNWEKRQTVWEKRRRGLPRLNSAPELQSELPPIQRDGKNSSEKSRRPLTPVANLRSQSSFYSSKSLPRNYRINLDLTPLIEVGAGVNIPSSERKRLTSLGSDLAQSSAESYTSSDSPKVPSWSSSSKADNCGFTGREANTTSTDSRDVNQTRSDSPAKVDVDGKDKMILRWLQTLQKNNETTSGDLLPSIKEGRPT